MDGIAETTEHRKHHALNDHATSHQLRGVLRSHLQGIHLARPTGSGQPVRSRHLVGPSPQPPLDVMAGNHETGLPMVQTGTMGDCSGKMLIRHPRRLRHLTMRLQRRLSTRNVRDS